MGEWASFGGQFAAFGLPVLLSITNPAFLIPHYIIYLSCTIGFAEGGGDVRCMHAGPELRRGTLRMKREKVGGGGGNLE